MRRMARSDGTELPAVDERLVMPDTRYEILDGRVAYVSPARDPHGSCHARIVAILGVLVAPGFKVACDLLTRASHTSDFAPDASVLPVARDPVTGGRQLEHLAFEVVSKGSLARITRKAHLLSTRGVRRIFAIGLQRGRVLEWSRKTGSWRIMRGDERVDDPTLVAPLALKDILATTDLDDVMERSLVARGTGGLTRAVAHEERVSAILAVLRARRLRLSAATVRAIEDERDNARLSRMLRLAATCARAVDVLGAQHTKRKRTKAKNETD